jgi:hypothetical protein
MTMNLDTAQAEGRESYHAGLLPTDHVYIEGSRQSIAWSRGYDAAMAEGPPVPTPGSAALRHAGILHRRGPAHE